MKHLLFLLFVGVVISLHGEIIIHDRFTLDYNEEFEIPNWASYALSPKDLIAQTKRLTYFTLDRAVTTDSASPKDYTGSNTDRGHNVPAKDCVSNDTWMKESFMMSNVFPQYPCFNRGIWRRVEAYVRTLVIFQGKHYVVTGCTVLATPPHRIGDNQVAIPHLFYKVIFDKDKNFVCAILVPHQRISTDVPIGHLKVPLVYIKAITNIPSFKDLLRD